MFIELNPEKKLTNKVKKGSRKSAIKHYIVPFEMINEELINNFKNNKTNQKYSNNIFKLKVRIWKYVAKLIGPYEFHFNSFNELAAHYNLSKIAEYIDENYSNIQNEYNLQRRSHVKVGVIYIIENNYYSYKNGRQWHSRTTFKGYRIVYGYIKNDKMIAYNKEDEPRHDIYAQKVAFLQTFNNLMDLKNYLLTTENIKLNNKNFTKFLKENKVSCRKSPNPENNYEMILSNEVSNHLANYIKERNSNRRRKQYDYNKRNPKSKELRKLVRSHHYREFLSIYLKSHPNLTIENLEYSIDSNIYSSYFKMPNHLKSWLRAFNDEKIKSFY